MSTQATTRPEEPLHRKRVLLTRAKEDAAALRSRLEMLGAAVVELPTITVQPPRDLAPLDRAVQDLDSYQWITFASRNAVRAVFDRLAALNLPSMLPADARVAAVGPATVRELAERGVTATCVPALATAVDLAGAMIQIGVEGKRVLLPTGDISRPELREMLEHSGALVTEVTAYRTARPTGDEGALEMVRRGELDAIVLASPSAMQNLASMLGPEAEALHRTRLVCIGRTTAEAVRELDLPPATIAIEPTIDGLVVAVVQACAMEKDHEHA
jgi:uroporphyrinogen III methyltransferase / synthase